MPIHLNCHWQAFERVLRVLTSRTQLPICIAAYIAGKGFPKPKPLEGHCKKVGFNDANTICHDKSCPELRNKLGGMDPVWDDHFEWKQMNQMMMEIKAAFDNLWAQMEQIGVGDCSNRQNQLNILSCHRRELNSTT